MLFNQLARLSAETLGEKLLLPLKELLAVVPLHALGVLPHLDGDAWASSQGSAGDGLVGAVVSLIHYLLIINLLKPSHPSISYSNIKKVV